MNRLHFLLTVAATAGLALSAQTAEIYFNSFDPFDEDNAFSANAWAGYMTRIDGA